MSMSHEANAARGKAECLRAEFISALIAKSLAVVGRRVKITGRDLSALYALCRSRHA